MSTIHARHTRHGTSTRTTRQEEHCLPLPLTATPEDEDEDFAFSHCTCLYANVLGQLCCGDDCCWKTRSSHVPDSIASIASHSHHALRLELLRTRHSPNWHSSSTEANEHLLYPHDSFGTLSNKFEFVSRKKMKEKSEKKVLGKQRHAPLGEQILDADAPKQRKRSHPKKADPVEQDQVCTCTWK